MLRVIHVLSLNCFDLVDELWWCSAWNFDGSECWVKVKSAELETRLAMDTTPFPWQRPANPQANLIQFLAHVDEITGGRAKPNILASRMWEG